MLLGRRLGALEHVGPLQALVLGLGEAVVGQQLDLLDVRQALDEPGDGRDVGLVVGVARHDGHADDDGQARLGEPPGVGEDLLVADAGRLAVALGVHELDVEQDEVRVREDGLEGLPGDVSRGVEGGVDAAAVAASEDVGHEAGLEERLAAGAGGAAAGVVVEGLVLEDLGDDVLGGGLAALHDNGLGVAGLGAAAAQGADLAVVVPGLALEAQRAARADAEAAAAADALVGEEDDLGLPGDALGVVAPRAAHGAALEEDGGPDARAVVDRELLDVEDLAGHGVAGSPERKVPRRRYFW